MSLTTRVLIGLVTGFLVGTVAPAGVAAIIGPVGTIFVNLIRMTVLPLVVSMLISSVGSIASSRALGRAGWRAMIAMVVLVAVAAAASALIAQPVLSRVQIDRSAALMLQPPPAVAAARPAPPDAPSRVAQWFIDLVPPNVVKAVQWAKDHGVFCAALVGGKRGRLADLADEAIVIASEHYGRVEDAHMTICHMLCYSFMENPQLAG